MLTTKWAESQIRRCLMMQDAGRCRQEALKTLTGLQVNGLSMGRLLHCLLQFSLSNRSGMVCSKQWHTRLHENKLAASTLRSKNTQVHLAPSELSHLNETPCCRHSVGSGTGEQRAVREQKCPQAPPLSLLHAGRQSCGFGSVALFLKFSFLGFLITKI